MRAAQNSLTRGLTTCSRDSVSLFDHTSGTALAPPPTADSATHSQWLTRDVAARLAIRNHLPLAQCAHFGQHKTAQALDHFLSLDPTTLTIDLLEQHLLAAETSVVAVGAAHGTPRTPFFEGCSPSPLAPSYASAAAVDVPGTEDVGAASASAKRCSSKGKGVRGGGGGNGGGGGGSGGGGGGSGGGGSGGSGGGSGGFGGGGGGSGGSFVEGGDGGGGGGFGGEGGGEGGDGGGGDGGPPLVDPLPPKRPAPSGVSQVDPLLGTVPGEVAVDSGAARGVASGGAEPGGAESGGAEPGGTEPGGVEPRGAEPGGVEPEGAESGDTEPGGAEPEGVESGGAEPRAGGSAAGDAGPGGTGGTGVSAGAGGPGGAGTTSPRGARTGGAGAAGSGGVGGAGAGGVGAGAAGAGGVASVGTGGAGAGAAQGTRAAGAGGATGVGPGGAGPGGADAGSGDTGRPRPYFVPLLQQVLGLLSSTGLPPPFLCPPPDQSQPPLQSPSPLPAPSPYIEQTGCLTERREPESRPASPICIGRHVPRPRPPPLPGTHVMALRPSSVPLRVPLPAPPESFLPAVPDPESDCARAASPTVSRPLATVVTDPSFESTAAFALVAELFNFAATCRLDYATALVAESASPPSVGGECALGTDVLEDRQEDFEGLAAAVPRFASMLLVPEGDPDAPDIPTLRSYEEAITGPYSS
ncbi:unnamed protein product [Closterium sp. NIES-54]